MYGRYPGGNPRRVTHAFSSSAVWLARTFLQAHPPAVNEPREHFFIKIGFTILDQLGRRIVFVCHVSCLAASLASRKSLRS